MARVFLDTLWLTDWARKLVLESCCWNDLDYVSLKDWCPESHRSYWVWMTFEASNWCPGVLNVVLGLMEYHWHFRGHSEWGCCHNTVSGYIVCINAVSLTFKLGLYYCGIRLWQPSAPHNWWIGLGQLGPRPPSTPLYSTIILWSTHIEPQWILRNFVLNVCHFHRILFLTAHSVHYLYLYTWRLNFDQLERSTLESWTWFWTNLILLEKF